MEWAKRMALAKFLDRGNETVFRLSARRFGIDYLIGGTLWRLRLPVAFENEQFVVYDLRSTR